MSESCLFLELITNRLGALYAIEEILDSGIHTSDEDIAVLAGELLDYVEAQKKSEDENNLKEIVNDKDLSIGYILNFSDTIFNNSLKQITEKRSNKNTGFNLLTSVTFYEILKLFTDYENLQYIIDPEELNKRKKYAKFHAARILKSLKNGEDPNEYTAPVEKKEDDETLPIVEPDGSNSDGLGLPDVKPTIEPSRSPTVDPEEEDDISSILPKPPTSKPKHLDESTSTPDLGLPDTSNLELPKIPQPASPIQQEPVNVEEIIEVNEIYTEAQKHAKFAVSAMNYEDKETSIRELEKAIELLNKLR